MKLLAILFLVCSTALAGPPGFMSPTLTSGLLGWWPMNEGTGTTINDYSGFGITGTAVSSPTWTNGVILSGLQVTAASGSYVNLGTTTITKLNYPLTICGWCRRNITTSYGVVYARRASSTIQYQLTWVKSNEGTHNNKVRLDTSFSGAITTFNSTNAWTASGYHHIAATYDGTNVCLYFDGAIDGVYPETRSITQSDIATRIGNDNGGVPASSDASFDDVRIYNRALTADEIKMLYGGGYGYKQ